MANENWHDEGNSRDAAYIDFLKRKAVTDPSAAENLRLFTSWNPKKRQNVIDKFNDPAFQKALAGGSREERKAQGISETVVDPTAGQARAVTQMSTVYNVRASYVHELRSLGLAPGWWVESSATSDASHC